MLFLGFSEISCVQASVSFNPVRISWVFFLLQYDETTLKEDRLGCDVSVSFVDMCCVFCAQLSSWGFPCSLHSVAAVAVARLTEAFQALGGCVPELELKQVWSTELAL